MNPNVRERSEACEKRQQGANDCHKSHHHTAPNDLEHTGVQACKSQLQWSLHRQQKRQEVHVVRRDEGQHNGL